MLSSCPITVLCSTKYFKKAIYTFDGLKLLIYEGTSEEHFEHGIALRSTPSFTTSGIVQISCGSFIIIVQHLYEIAKDFLRSS